MSRYVTAGDLVNNVALELGLILEPINDPYASSEQTIIQLRSLLNIAGKELVTMHPWEVLASSFQITTTSADTGLYDLPDDFSYMRDQTGWERTERVPLFGPLSAQDWNYVLGRRLANQTIYASFRFKRGQFAIFPNDPVTDGLDINFEYVSRNWVEDSTNPGTNIEKAQASADTILYEETLIGRYLKVKYLMAKGLDATPAQDDFNQLFMSWTGKDTGAEVLNAGGAGRVYPYLDTYRNTGDTNYGSSLP